MKPKSTSGTPRISVFKSIEDVRRVKDETNWEWLDKATDDEIDTSDIPPLDEDFFRNAVFRPPRIRKMVSIRLEEHVLEWFKKQGPGYQTRIQSVLRHYVAMARNLEFRDHASTSRTGKTAAKAKAKAKRKVDGSGKAKVTTSAKPSIVTR